MQHEKVLILDFGSQYTQLIARRVREHKVYSKIFPHTVTAVELNKKNIEVELVMIYIKLIFNLTKNLNYVGLRSIILL